MLTGRVLDPKFYERESTKSSVDDLILGRGDVSFRAAFTLRVTESQPHLTWRFEHDLCAHFPHLYPIFYLIYLALYTAESACIAAHLKGVSIASRSCLWRAFFCQKKI